MSTGSVKYQSLGVIYNFTIVISNAFENKKKINIHFQNI